MGQDLYIVSENDENVNLVYEEPEQGLNWGVNIDGSEVSEDVTVPLLIMMHGFPGETKKSHNNVFGEVSKGVVEKGFPTLRFDFRGCGDSDGDSRDFSIQSALKDLKAVIEWARKEKGFSRFYFLGRGLSMPLAFTFCEETYARGFLSLSGMLDIQESALYKFLTSEDAKAEYAEFGYATYKKVKIGKALPQTLKHFKVEPLIRSVKKPILIQHGSKDAETPLEAVNSVREFFSFYADIQIFEGGDYGITADNMRPHLIRQIVEFLKKFN